MDSIDELKTFALCALPSTREGHIFPPSIESQGIPRTTFFFGICPTLILFTRTSLSCQRQDKAKFATVIASIVPFLPIVYRDPCKIQGSMDSSHMVKNIVHFQAKTKYCCPSRSIVLTENKYSKCGGFQKFSKRGLNMLLLKKIEYDLYLG